MYSEKLHQLRKKLNLSQSEIAEQTGTSYRAYSSYERGERNPSLDFLEKIEKLFNVNLNWLIADDGGMFNSAEFKTNMTKSEFRSEVINILKEKNIL